MNHLLQVSVKLVLKRLPNKGSFTVYLSFTRNKPEANATLGRQLGCFKKLAGGGAIDASAHF